MLIVKQAKNYTAEELDAKGLTGIPPEWPIEAYPYDGKATIPDGFVQMTEDDFEILKQNNQAAYDKWVAQFRPLPLPPAPTEVVTQTEKSGRTLKLFGGSGPVDANGNAVVDMKVPGKAMVDFRWIAGGIAFFDTHDPGDRISGVYLVDKDNVTGAATNGEVVVGSYTDDDAPAELRGWWIPPIGHVETRQVSGYGQAPSGLYVRIMGAKGGGKTSGMLYANLEWMKNE